MQDYVTAGPLALLGAAHLAALASLLAIVSAARPNYPGWRIVRPSGTHWFCFWGSWAFGALIAWVWLFVGSARYDAEFQMLVALVLALTFTAMAAVAGIQIVRLGRQALRWRGELLRWRRSGKDYERKISDFHTIRRSWAGAFVIEFEDGSVLKLDFYADNASELLAAFSEHLGGDVY